MFKIIEGFSLKWGGAYRVSERGEVFSFARTEPLKTHVNPKTGYVYVSLQKSGKPHRVSVHRLVAQAFIPNPDDKPEVNHKDRNKLNNSVENLEWCTHRENIRHAHQTQPLNT